MPIDRRELIGEETTSRRDPAGVIGLPLCDEFDEFWMEWDIAVVAEFPDWDMKPVMLPDADDWVSVECTEFPDSHPGPSQQQHT
jgi:hypothetical protein